MSADVRKRERYKVPPGSKPPTSRRDPSLPGRGRRTRRRRILVALLCIPLVLCASYWLLGAIAFADTASVVELKGLVQTRHEDEALWLPARHNQLLGGKHHVRTGEGSGVQLMFFDVSTVELYENTEVSITRIAQRRGGSAVNVVLKTWVGKTAIRAVRFIDPSSTFQVDTPTTSTVVRGARFTVDVTEEGTTQIDVAEGIAKVQLVDQEVILEVGERITLERDGTYATEQVFQPDAQPVFDKVGEAWYGPGEELTFELTETEVNHFLAAMGEETGFFLEDAQVWFVDDEARIAATVVEPVRFDLSAALGVTVEGGQLKPQVRSIAAGIALPVPAPILDLAIETIMGRVESYLAEAYSLVAFTDVQVRNGYVLVAGHKQAGAMDTP